MERRGHSKIPTSRWRRMVSVAQEDMVGKTYVASQLASVFWGMFGGQPSHVAAGH